MISTQQRWPAVVRRKESPVFARITTQTSTQPMYATRMETGLPKCAAGLLVARAHPFANQFTESPP
jgi:precorrin-6x reductase